MNETNAESPHHPHEPEIPPTLDAQGRCLICCQLARIAELERRVERLTKERDEARVANGELLIELQHCPTCEKLRAQLAEREEDRALLDWLEANWEFVFQRVSSPGWFYFDRTQQLRMPAKSLRAAIRAARAQEDGK